jgi:signal transduction histidine kinase
MTSPSARDPPDFDPETVLDRMEDGFFALDTDWHVTYANARGREVLRHAMAELPEGTTVDGRHLWDAVPEAVDTAFYEHYHEAMETQTVVTFEAWFEPLETWFDVRAFPSESGLSVYFRDVTEQKRLQQERQESLEALQELYAISSDREREFEAKLTALLETGREYLGLDNGFLTRVDDDTQYVEAAVGSDDIRVGDSRPLAEAYCRRTVELDHLLTIVNAADEGWSDDPAYEGFEFDTYIGGRVEADDGIYGTLCFADPEARADGFTDTERTFVELLTRWVRYELEREQAKAELERERDRLEEFAGVVSHDLRNPLNTAVGRLALLREEVDDDGDHLPALERSLERMGELIDGLLTLAREGMAVQNPDRVRPADVAERAWHTTGTADATLDVGPVDPVLADESRLRQLFENLFRNAVEHGGPGVAVTVGPLEGRGFYVADDGPGIPADERDRVRETGYTTADGGTGFGLSIVESIADAHGWGMRVVESETGGARFEFTGVEPG